MTESHSPAGAHDDTTPHVAYGKVWFALLVLTVLEYFYAAWKKDSFIVLVLGLMFLASVKAILVALYFMHLKFEGNWVYIWLIPAGFLVLVFIGALYPDIGMQRSIWPDYPDEEEAATAPAIPGTGAFSPVVMHVAWPVPAAVLERRAITESSSLG
jgi:cytochrome c oxidase subunit 4